MSEERLEWTFDRAVFQSDTRQARALEFIAYYLDRIEGHMAKIAATLSTDAAGDITVLSALKNIANED